MRARFRAVVKWLDDHVITLTFMFIIAFVAFIAWRQQINFNDHKRLDQKEINANCILLQQRWDLLHNTYEILLAPIPNADSYASDTELHRFIAETNGAREAKKQQLLKELGPRTTCDPGADSSPQN